MNTFTLPAFRRHLTGAFLALVLAIGLMAPSTAHAQRFGHAFGRGLGWGLGFGLGSALVYNTVYGPGPVVYTAPPATVYYVPQTAPTVVYTNPAPSSVVVNSPAPAPTAVAPTTAVTSTAGKLSKIVYDSTGKPAGVIVLDPDGRQEFIPLAPQ